MSSKVKTDKEDILNAALEIVRAKGIDGLTVREIALSLGVSTRPIFTHYNKKERLLHDLYLRAKSVYEECVLRGLEAEQPFIGFWKQYIRFAWDEPNLYRFLFLSRPDKEIAGPFESMKYARELARKPVMETYRMDEHTADIFFMYMWLVISGFCTLIVTDNCPYTNDQMQDVASVFSLSLLRAFKENPELVDGKFDRDRLFREALEL